MSHEMIENKALEIVKKHIRDNEIFFATTQNDEEIINKAIETAEPNDKPNDFPDFIFEDGFIEHFAISSSKEDRKGSRFKKEESLFNKDFSKKEKEFEDYMDMNPSFDEVKSISQDYHYNEPHSHDNLVNSFICNLESHIESAKNYKGNNKVKIYLVEYNEFNLHMYISYRGLKTERHYGDLLFREKDTLYRLSRDKELLEKLYLYKQDIDYVILITCRRIEIINIKDIPEIIKLIKFDYVFSEVVAFKMMSTHCISVKKNTGDTNE